MDIAKAIEILGVKTQADVASSLGISRQAVYQWPEELPQATADRVVGAAHRLGKLTIKCDDETAA